MECEQAEGGGRSIVGATGSGRAPLGRDVLLETASDDERARLARGAARHGQPVPVHWNEPPRVPSPGQGPHSNVAIVESQESHWDEIQHGLQLLPRGPKEVRQRVHEVEPRLLRLRGRQLRVRVRDVLHVFQGNLRDTPVLTLTNQLTPQHLPLLRHPAERRHHP